MNIKEFKKYLMRDAYCPHCGLDDDTLVPQHRIAKGYGGSKMRHRAANILVMCSWANGLMERDAGFAREAKEKGWKLESWQDPAEEPFFDECDGFWYKIDDQFNRIRLG
jgi:hypothetical protein